MYKCWKTGPNYTVEEKTTAVVVCLPSPALYFCLAKSYPGSLYRTVYIYHII